MKKPNKSQLVIIFTLLITAYSFIAVISEEILQEQTEIKEIEPSTSSFDPMQYIQSLLAKLEENPNDIKTLTELAQLNLSIGRWERCIELFEKALKLTKKEEPDMLTDLGICYRQNGEVEKALKVFQKARTIDPNYWQALFNEVVVLVADLNEITEAQSKIKQLKKIAPANQQEIKELEKRIKEQEKPQS